MTPIDRDDARRVLWHLGERTSETALEPDGYETALITAMLVATPTRSARLSRAEPSLAAAVGLATGSIEDCNRLREIALGATPDDRGEPTAAERALATLYFHPVG